MAWVWIRTGGGDDEFKSLGKSGLVCVFRLHVRGDWRASSDHATGAADACDTAGSADADGFADAAGTARR